MAMKKPKPLFFVKDDRIFHRPVKTAEGSMRLGFCVCIVVDGVDPDEVCAILNKGSPPADGE